MFQNGTALSGLVLRDENKIKRDSAYCAKKRATSGAMASSRDGFRLGSLWRGRGRWGAYRKNDSEARTAFFWEAPHVGNGKVRFLRSLEWGSVDGFFGAGR